MRRLGMAVAVAAAVCGTSAQAQWGAAADGSTTLTMQVVAGPGTFTCSHPLAFQGGNGCTANGHVMRLTNGTAWADLTYTPLNIGPITASSAAAVEFDFAQISIQTGGIGEFVWPAMKQSGEVLFGLQYSFAFDGNEPVFLPVFWLGLTPQTLMPCCGHIFLQPNHDSGPGTNYTPHLGSFADDYLVVGNTATMSATIHLTPEPSTYAVMSFGLVCLLCFTKLGRARISRHS